MKINKIIKPESLHVPPVFYWISGIWIAIVALHYFNGNTHPIFNLLIGSLHKLFSVPLLLTGVFIIWLFVAKTFHKYYISFSVTPIQIVLGSLLLILTGLLYKGLEKNIITVGDIPAAGLSLGLKLLLLVVWLAILMVSTYSAGQWIVRWLRLKKLSLFSQSLLAVTFGYIILNLGLLLLAVFQHLKGLEVMLLLGILIVTGIPHFKILIKTFQTKIVIDSSRYSFIFWCGWFLLLTTVLNLTIMILPFPTGWDSLTFYFNIAKELAYTGSFIHGQYAYPVELAYSMGYVVGNFLNLKEYADMLAVFVCSFGGIVASLSVVLLGKQIGGWKTGILGGLLYSSMPLITFFNGWEPKSETTLTIFMALTLYAYLRWRRSRDNAWLITAGIFSAFAVLIKLTSVLLIVSLGVVFLYDLVWGAMKGTRVKVISGVFPALGIFCILLLPWISLHLWERQWQFSEPRDLILGTDQIVNQNIGLVVKQWQNKTDAESVSTAYWEDYGRYVGEEEGWWGLERYLPEKLARIPMSRYLSLPWDVVMSSNRKNTNMLTNSLLLMLLPLLAWLWLFHRKAYKQLNLPRTTQLLVVFSLVYLIIWVKVGWGVAWYGLGMIISFTMLVALTLLALWKYPKLRYVVLTLFLLNQGLNLALHMNHYGHTVLTSYALGKMTKAQAAESLLPRLTNIGDVINNDPQVQSGQKKVLRVSGYFPYFVNNHRHVLIDDIALDYFNMIDLANDRDNEKTKAALQNAHIKYIAADVSIFYNDMTEDKTLENKVLRFMEFASQTLYLIDAHEQGGVGVLLLEVK